MGNATKSEVTLSNGMTLILDFNALCELESMVNMSYMAFEQRLYAEQRATDIRLLFWAATRRYHPDVTLGDAGNLVAEHGGRLGELLGITTEPATEDSEGNGQRPRKASRAKKNPAN